MLSRNLLGIFLLVCGPAFLTATAGTETSSAVSSADAEIRDGEHAAVDTRKSIFAMWESSGLTGTDISFKAFYYGLKGYEKLAADPGNAIGERLIIVDFSLPSDRERLIVFNTKTNRVERSSLVAHGRNSGEHRATKFSNTVSSFQSSLGFYHTAETYYGKHGYSLRLDGLETGFNDKARERAIVIHGADYATRDFIDRHGRLGRSLGCPSLPPDLSEAIIDMIKEDHLLFIYANDPEYLQSSPVLQSAR